LAILCPLDEAAESSVEMTTDDHHDHRQHHHHDHNSQPARASTQPPAQLPSMIRAPVAKRGPDYDDEDGDVFESLVSLLIVSTHDSTCAMHEYLAS
jgi:hypothetical protein